MDSKAHRYPIAALALIIIMFSGLGLFPRASASALAAVLIEAPNGIVARIHTAAEIEASWTEESEGKRFLDHPAAARVELLTGVADSRLSRRTEAFFPFAVEVVAQAIDDMSGFITAVEVEVFILPTPPVAPMSSFALDGIIYLAPGYGPVAPSTVAYITTHEMGHVLTTRYVDPRPARWQVYCRLRGIPLPGNDGELRHAERPREILAEDIRDLFGGPLATTSGSIENHDLLRPARVAGLAELLTHFLAHGEAAEPTVLAGLAFPNPCNPTTTITMTLPVDLPGTMASTAELEIYDVGGRKLRRIQGGRIEGDQLLVRWDGSDDNGRTVGSGRYLYLLKLDSLTARGAVIIVR